MAGTWSSGGNLNTARIGLAGCGAQDSGLSFGGDVNDTTSNITEEYNGTSWSDGGNLNVARRYLAGCGTQTAGLSAGGYTSSYINNTEEYDGTSWSGVGFLTERRLLRQGRSMIEGEWVVRRESVLCPKSSQKDNFCPKELNH